MRSRFSPSPAAHDADARVEPARELLLGVPGEGVPTPFVPHARPSGDRRDALFGLANGEGPPQDLLGEPLLVVRRGERSERPGVSGRKGPLADLLAHRGGQAQQAQGVGDGRSVFPDAPGDLLLGEAELLLLAAGMPPRPPGGSDPPAGGFPRGPARACPDPTAAPGPRPALASGRLSRPPASAAPRPRSRNGRRCPAPPRSAGRSPAP